MAHVNDRTDRRTGTARRTVAIQIALAFAASAILMAALASPALAEPSDQQQIRDLYRGVAKAFDARDAVAIMKFYAPGKDLVVFDVVPPLQYVGAYAYRKNFEGFFGGLKTMRLAIEQLAITNDGHLAFAHSIQRTSGTDTSGKPFHFTVRVTDCLKKMNGKWLIVHEHVSVPVNLNTGRALLNATGPASVQPIHTLTRSSAGS